MELDEGQAPVEPGAEEVISEPQAVDYAALEQQASELKPGMTLGNLMGSYRESQSQLGQFHTLRDEHTRLQQDYETVKPIVEGVRNDPAFADHLRSSINSYYDESPEVPATPQAPMIQAVDPMQHRMQILETDLARRDQDDQMNKLRADFGDHIDKATETKIWERVGRGEGNDLEALFWKEKGREMIGATKKEAVDEVTAQIKKNNDSYSPLPDSDTAPGESTAGPRTTDQEVDIVAQIMQGKG